MHVLAAAHGVALVLVVIAAALMLLVRFGITARRIRRRRSERP